MANGQQIAQENVQVFITWRASKTDADFRSMVHRGVLSRREIAIECGFAKSALDQNPRIKASLRDLEDQLRARGVLPPVIEKTAAAPESLTLREPNKQRVSLDADQVHRYETHIASLKAEVAELKRALEKYAILREALADAGRMPR